MVTHYNIFKGSPLQASSRCNCRYKITSSMGLYALNLKTFKYSNIDFLLLFLEQKIV